MTIEGWLYEGLRDPVNSDGAPNERKGWPHERLLLAAADRTAGPADLAVLLRATLRSESIDRGYSWTLKVPETFAARLEGQWQASGLQYTGGTVSALEWQPTWLRGSEETAVDACMRPEVRRNDQPATGDPTLAALELSGYTSTAQREAVRSAFCSEPDATVVINLPTGAGKSLCAFLPSILPKDDGGDILGVSVIVVPTVALALDLEERIGARVGHPVAFRPERKEDAEAIRSRCAAGVQGPVIVSPEALQGGLLRALRQSAQEGWLRYFVIDEAHMVLSWGDEFRPAFLRLSAVRSELVAKATKPFRTLLMSATLTEYHLRWLRTMFSGPGPFRIVHAARLRPEPAYWMAIAPSDEERRRWVEEAVYHLPRPAIVYTTHREDCDRWHTRLRALGFARIGVMSGDTPDDERRELLRRWTADELDLVVATSAFGLGIDKKDVRAILHAQLPESVDRFYQDVGRAGRDGKASVSLLVTTPYEFKRVSKLGQPRFISSELGLERWRRMYQMRRKSDADPDAVCLDLDAARELDMAGDYNRAWNVRTLQLLQRVGALEFTSCENEQDGIITVRTRAVPHLEQSYWDGPVQDLRSELADEYRRARTLLHRLLAPGEACLADIFTECYSAPAFELSVTKACGGCPACRASSRAPYSGPIIAKLQPPGPAPTPPLHEELRTLLSGAPCALIFTDDLTREAMELLLDWFGKVGVRNFVTEVPEVAACLDQVFLCASHRPLFRHSKPPLRLETAAQQPTAVIVGVPEPKWWPSFYKSIATRPSPTVLVLPTDARCPENPARRLRETAPFPVLAWREWEDRFCA